MYVGSNKSNEIYLLICNISAIIWVELVQYDMSVEHLQMVNIIDKLVSATAEKERMK